VRPLKTSLWLEKGRDRTEFAKGLSDPTSLTSFSGSDGIQLLSVENIFVLTRSWGCAGPLRQIDPSQRIQDGILLGRQRKPLLARVALTQPVALTIDR
jgi:hypothetical protein